MIVPTPRKEKSIVAEEKPLVVLENRLLLVVMIVSTLLATGVSLWNLWF